MASHMIARLKIRQQVAPRTNDIQYTLDAVRSWTALPLPADVLDPITRAAAALEQAKAELAAALDAANAWEI